MSQPINNSGSAAPPREDAAQSSAAQREGGEKESLDPSDISQLFEEHNRALHSFLMMRIGNEQEAREVAQEAYVRLLQLHRPGAVSFLRAYLFKTALNIAMDRARQRTARGRLDRLDAGGDLIDHLSPDRRVAGREDLELLERALQELPPKYRRAFILHRFEDRTTGEIARDLGVEKRMVRNYISRTVIYCRLRLQGALPSEAKAQVMS